MSAKKPYPPLHSAIDVLEKELSLRESLAPDLFDDLKEASLARATAQGLDPDVMKKLLGL